MKFIKFIVDRINMLNRKGLSPYYSPDTICEEVHAASLDLWKKYIVDFERTQLISVYLDPFRGQETVALTSGAGTLTTSLGKYKTAVRTPADVKVTQYDQSHWDNAVADSIRVMDAANPGCRIDNTAIKVRPTSITTVEVHFLKFPVKPVFAFTLSGDDYIYDDVNSVDIEWPEICHPDIVDRVFAGLGISQREGFLSQYSNMERATEGK